MADEEPKELEGWGQRIYEARTSIHRKRHGRVMSQAELGAAAQVSGPLISLYESETHWPGWSKWIAMGEKLDVTIGWLIAGEHPMEREKTHGPPRRQKPGKLIKRPDPERGNDEPRQQRA